jgi:hypothetical protein
VVFDSTVPGPVAVPGDTKDGITGIAVLDGALTVIYILAEEVPSEFMILVLHMVAASNE